MRCYNLENSLTRHRPLPVSREARALLLAARDAVAGRVDRIGVAEAVTVALVEPDAARAAAADDRLLGGHAGRVARQHVERVGRRRRGDDRAGAGVRVRRLHELRTERSDEACEWCSHWITSLWSCVALLPSGSANKNDYTLFCLLVNIFLPYWQTLYNETDIKRCLFGCLIKLIIFLNQP